MKVRKMLIVAAVLAAAIASPGLAHAAAAGGGGMPYSEGLGTIRTSVTGEIAGIICLIAIIGGVAAYLMRSVMDELLQKIVHVTIGVAIIGGAATFLATMGVAGAIIH
jgi:type IV secretory pathway VirB2 component (pilin)